MRRHVTDSLHQKRVAPDLVVRVDAAQRKTEARTKMEATMIKKRISSSTECHLCFTCDKTRTEIQRREPARNLIFFKKTA